MSLLSGFKAWYHQRISAIFLLIGLVYITFEIIALGRFSYNSWINWVNNDFNAIILLITTWSLCLHAWIGLRDIILDYVSTVWLRLTTLTIFSIAFLTMCLWISILLFGV